MTQSRMVTGTAFVVDWETVGYTEKLEHINAAAGQLQPVVDIAVCSNLADVAVGDTVVVGSVFVVVVSAAAFVVVVNAAVDAFVVVSAAGAALAVVVSAAVAALAVVVADDYLYYVNFLAIHNYCVFFHYFDQMQNSLKSPCPVEL